MTDSHLFYGYSNNKLRLIILATLEAIFGTYLTFAFGIKIADVTHNQESGHHSRKNGSNLTLAATMNQLKVQQDLPLSLNINSGYTDHVNNVTTNTTVLGNKTTNLFDLDSATLSIILLVSSVGLVFSIFQVYFALVLLFTTFKSNSKCIESCLKYFIFHGIVFSGILCAKTANEKNYYMMSIVEGVLWGFLQMLLLFGTLSFLKEISINSL